MVSVSIMVYHILLRLALFDTKFARLNLCGYIEDIKIETINDYLLY